VANTLWAYAKMGRKPGAGLMRVLHVRTEAMAGTFNAQNVANTLWAYARMGQDPGAGLMRVLEGRAEAVAGTFNAQNVTNTLWAYASMGREGMIGGWEPGAGLMRVLEGQAEAIADTFDGQDVANTLWAYAVFGRKPGAKLMRVLEGRAEATAGTFNAQNVANTLWAACVFATFRGVEEESRWMQTLSQRLVSIGETGCFNSCELCQLHQFFLWFSLEPRLGVEAINDMRSLKAACRSAFECREYVPSATQQQVSETLRILGLSVEDEARCPKSGYSIDMLVHDSALEIGGERSRWGGPWAVEFDGPSHFLPSGAPIGATLLKRRHLQLLGYALVSVPYWEWDRCNGEREREQYLRDKLESSEPLKNCVSFGGPKQEPQGSDTAYLSGVISRFKQETGGSGARSEEMAVGWGTLSSAYLLGRERGAQNGECADVFPRETPAREGQGRAGAESGEEEHRKLREQARKSKAGKDVWEVRESKTKMRSYWFNRKTGESRWEHPLSHERVGAKRKLEEGCG
jgi:hypothetical protein